MLISLISLFWERVSTAFTTVPGWPGWLLSLEILSLYGVCALGIGFVSHFLVWSPLPRDWVQVVIRSIFAPALVEEIGFRVLLLPHPQENLPSELWWIWGGLSLSLFVLYHPFNALTGFPAGYPCFLDPIFLLLAALLGIACAIAYAATGSLWPPAFIHWSIVVIWLCRLGGMDRLT